MQVAVQLNVLLIGNISRRDPKNQMTKKAVFSKVAAHHTKRMLTSIPTVLGENQMMMNTKANN
jgi:hypothetical protein